MTDRSVTARIKGFLVEHFPSSRNHALVDDAPMGVGPFPLWIPPAGSVRGRDLPASGVTADLRRFAGDPVVSHPGDRDA